MPELPEVETMRRGLLPAVGGVIRSIEFPNFGYRPIAISPQPDQWPEMLSGKTITAIDRIAKRVVVRIDDGHRIVFQPKMAGITLIADPPTEKHTRLVLQLDQCGCSKILYWDRRGLGTVHLLDEQGCDRLLGPDKLGPDALAISENEFVERFQTLNRPIKPALLDQKLIAGIGNLYASEILHRAKVNPELRCNAVLGKSWSQIYYWMRSVLELAIDNQGSTLGDGTYRNAINGEGAFQHFHQVYARAGERCSVCKKGEIQRIVQAQRSTFFCPICQKKSKKLPRAK